MKISCDSCQSKFTVGDDKVAGNILRIRCKKCGSTLVVNGAEGTTTTEPADPTKDGQATSTASIAPASSGEGKPADVGAEPKKAEGDADSKKDDSRESVVAARREGSEKAADLFAGVDKAGSEPESTEGEDVDMKLTGERSPSS
ncbi:MAG TPA: zinc-ribbon domain-containing protein, partial [Polyangiaceae bacterium]|nr:zinc-ribbon domain-containing protein [Polyangiaceae bacterium]